MSNITLTIIPGNIPETMRGLRKSAHITLSSVAEKLYMTPQGLYYLEKGYTQHGERMPRINRLAEWADALGYTLEVTLTPKQG